MIKWTLLLLALSSLMVTGCTFQEHKVCDYGVDCLPSIYRQSIYDMNQPVCCNEVGVGLLNKSDESNEIVLCKNNNVVITGDSNKWSDCTISGGES